MLIHIMYPGNTFDYVREFMLSNLIDTGRISRFRRASGWVSIGDDRIRSNALQHPYAGTERRGTAHLSPATHSGMFQTGSIRKD